ncbi:MAG: oligosaccharide flippase family protein [Patescibacteria group bacterium]
MKKYVNFIVTHPLFSGSMVMIVGLNLANFIQYFFHLILGRLLGPSDYSELVSLFSVSLLLAVPFSLGLVVVKFISQERDKKRVVSFASWVEKKAFFFGLLVGILLLFLSPLISDFLKIDDVFLAALLAPMFLVAIVTYFNRSTLQGLLKFKELATNLVGEATVRLALAVLLVLAGYRVLGAISGSLIAGVFALLLTRMVLRGYLGRVTQTPQVKELFKYSVPVVLMTLSLTSFYSTDVVLVKHYFPAFEAGIYSSLSALGKIVLYGVAPVSSVMFPLVSQRHSWGEGFRRIFLYSLGLTLAGIIVILTVYKALPELAITVLFGESYLAGAPLLFLFGIFAGVLALASLLLNFFISLGKVRVVIPALFFTLLQIVGIVLFHGELKSVIWVSTVSVSLLLLILVLYSGYEARRGEI